VGQLSPVDTDRVSDANGWKFLPCHKPPDGFLADAQLIGDLRDGQKWPPED
jgi:hypothetical protein